MDKQAKTLEEIGHLVAITQSLFSKRPSPIENPGTAHDLFNNFYSSEFDLYIKLISGVLHEYKAKKSLFDSINS